MSARRDPQAGFTLIETLVALAVLATGAVTLLIGVERHAAAVRGISDRIAGRWVAENALAATALGLPMEDSWRRALGTEWEVELMQRQLSTSGLAAVDARATVLEADGQGASVLVTGYLPRVEAGQ